MELYHCVVGASVDSHAVVIGNWSLNANDGSLNNNLRGSLVDDMTPIRITFSGVIVHLLLCNSVAI